MKSASLSLTVENRVEELTRIYGALDAFADRSQLPEPVRRALLLVVEELFSNIVRYGYGVGVRDSVALSLEQDGEDIQLTIRDRGVPFDVSGTPRHPELDQTVDDMPVGGLGLFLVREFARSVTNRRDGDVNITEVRVPIAVRAQPAPRI